MNNWGKQIEAALRAKAEEHFKQEAKKEVEGVFCPVHHQFVRLIPGVAKKGQLSFQLEGCCEEVVRKAQRMLNGEHHSGEESKDVYQMNRAVRRIVLAELFSRAKDDDEPDYGPHLLEHFPAVLQVDKEELKSTCQLMAAEGLIFMQELPAVPDEYVVKIEAKGREAHKERNDELPLWLDILWVLRADGRREIELSRDGRHLMEPVKRLKEILVDSQEHLLQDALVDLDRKSFIEIKVVNNYVILMAKILANGKLFLKQDHRAQGVNHMTNIDQSIRIDADGSIVNFQSSLQQTSQRIDNSSLAQQDQIKTVLSELLSILQTAPPERSEEADTVRESAEQLIRDATKKKPVEKRVLVSAEGLKEAAEAISDVVPKVLPTASLLAQLVIQCLG